MENDDFNDSVGVGVGGGAGVGGVDDDLSLPKATMVTMCIRGGGRVEEEAGGGRVLRPLKQPG